MNSSRFLPNGLLIAQLLLVLSIAASAGAQPTRPQPSAIPVADPWLLQKKMLDRDAVPTGPRPAEPARVTAPEGTWSFLPPSPPPPISTPISRGSHTAIYDPVRNRMVVFGGTDGSYRNDTWVLALGSSPSWTQLVTAGTPPAPRRLHAAVYDSNRDRMVVFGGFDGGYYDDVWALSLTGTPTWTQLAPTGPLPAPRADFDMVYDPVGDRIVAFGGYDGVSPPANRRRDVWELTLSGTPAWHDITPVGGPTARSGQRAIYDPVRQRMVVFGGYDVVMLKEVWALSLSGPAAWTNLAPSGTAPAPRADHAVLYDALHDRLVTFGGYDGPSSFADVWALPLSGSPVWSHIVPSGSGPSACWGPTIVYDAASDRMVVFGGMVGAYPTGQLFGLNLSGTPLWDTVPSTPAPGPTARAMHSAILDPLRSREILFGGTDGSHLNDIWALSLGSSPAWTPLGTSGTPPTPRRLHGAVLDAVHDRMIVFGGYDGGFYNDVWTLTLAGTPTWTQLSPTGTPPAPRADFAMVYDPAADRVLVFGGYDGLSPPSNRRGDLWALTLSGTPAWHDITPASGPTARSGHRAAYDAVHQRMIVFGGYDTDYLNETWALSLAGPLAWTLLAPAGTAPSVRVEQSVIYDSQRDRLVVQGGYDSSFASGHALDGTYALTLGATPTWTDITSLPGNPGPRWGHSAVYEALYDRMLFFGGADGYVFYRDGRALTWDRPTPVELSLVSVEAEPGLVRLRWYSADRSMGSAALERREGGGEWSALGTLAPDGEGRIAYDDRSVTPGATYSYRLALLEDGRRRFLGEATVTVPAEVALDIRWVNRGVPDGRLMFRCALPGTGSAKLVLLDVTGRRVLERELGSTAGVRTVDLGASRGMPAGVYLARLIQGARSVTTRAVLSR
ncbi:MAG: hypothetical protein HZC42_00265 [Candidatus Eisenbacteria bacterium]|nr:hypothetical protein [Candidatus Eisenbacteria bacterium]